MQIKKLENFNHSLNSSERKAEDFDRIKYNIQVAIKEYQDKLNQLSNIDRLLCSAKMERNLMHKICFENNLRIIDKSSCGFLAEVNNLHNNFKEIKILVVLGRYGEKWAKLKGYWS